MSFDYGVLGGGRQGTAAAFDMATRGDTASVSIADLDPKAAQRSARRVNELTGSDIARGVGLDVTDPAALAEFLQGIDSFLSAVPYYLNLPIAEVAIEARSSMCDLGGNTAIVRQQLELDSRARDAGVSIIPDCGQVPGMGTSLMTYTMGLLDEPREVIMWDGGIPARPEPPWNYALTFNIAGLTNEYDGNGIFLRNGEITEVPCFDPEGYELLQFPPPFGELESFVTAGGTSTMPWTFAGKLQTLENRTIRYPGHAAQWQAFRDAGLFEQESIEVQGARVRPRDVLHAVLGPRLEVHGEFEDAVVIRVVARGRHQGSPAEAQLDLIDFFDPDSGFTSMQRTTGWDGAIVAEMMARGETTRGAVPRELSVDPVRYVEELRARGFSIAEELRFIEEAGSV
ncbi:MAG: saccharopine dehydrogenase C-terminal domain-containing protein [Thermoanaerobaculia bacterium]